MTHVAAHSPELATKSNHNFSCPLLFGDWKSRAVWAAQTPDTLLLFVHGFGGSATSTWSELSSLLTGVPECARSDLVFFGYDGLYRRAQVAALDLRQFLDKFLADPAKHVNFTMGGLARRLQFSYCRIVFVAHSLGAIVGRRAILDAAATKTSPWAQKCELVLYAPAHAGADIIPLLSETITVVKSRILSLAVPAAKYRFQALLDLEPNCQTLTQLLEDTLSELGTSPNAPHLVARRVLLADRDKVVSPNRFAKDPPARAPALRGTHVTICKADSLTAESLVELRAAL